MPAHFVAHRIARDSIRDWRRRLQARNRRGGSELANAYFNFLEAELIRTGGHPAGARTVEWVRPELNVWEFQHQETWIVYTIQRRGGWWARLKGQQEVRIVLLRMFDGPPPRAQLELLARAVSPRG